MTAHAGTRAEDVDARVAVGKADGLPDIDPKFFRQAGELIGDGDVHIPGGVLHQLDHFGRGGIRFDDVTLDEDGIQVTPGFGRFRRHAADHAGILDQLAQDLSGQDPLRGVAQEEIGARFETGPFQDGRDQVQRGARRGGRFQHHQVPFAQTGDDGLGRRDHGAHVGELVFAPLIFVVLVLVERASGLR